MTTENNRWIDAANRFGRVESQVAQVSIQIEHLLHEVDAFRHDLLRHMDSDERWMQAHAKVHQEQDIEKAEYTGFKKAFQVAGKAVWPLVGLSVGIAIKLLT